MDPAIPITPQERPDVDSTDDREPVERLAEDYLERLRRGERPPVEEYVARHPELAGEIRDVFSALAMVEDLKPKADELPDPPAGSRPVRSGRPIERLGDYRILREVGRGGMGVVYEAEQQSLGRRVALKVLAPWSSANPQTVLRFQREARSAAQLHHTNIVPVFAVGEHDGLYFYAMQFIRGLGLDQVLEEVKRIRQPAEADDPEATDESATEVARTLINGQFGLSHPPRRDEPDSDSGPAGPMPDLAALRDESDVSSIGLPGHSQLTSTPDSVLSYARSVARIGVQAAEALEYAHAQGMLHRDIKPSNLLLDGQGTVWVTDFGLAKASEDDDLTRTGDLVGTLRYMAPERFRGRCDARSDVYALGLALYELLALRPAFVAPDRNRLIHLITQAEPPRLRKLDPQVPRDLETIVHKAMEKEPKDRYPSAGLLADDLRRWLGHEPIRARPSGPVERLLKWTRRKPTLAALVLVSTLAAAALLASAVVGYVEVSRSLHRERRTSYFQRIALAERAWSGYDVGRAEDLLDDGLPEFRGWEWRYLKRLCHAELFSARAHGGRDPNPVAFSPDGTQLASAGEAGQITIWDATTGRVAGSLPGHEGGVYAVAFSPDGTRLASAGHDGAVQLWEVATGRPLFGTPPRHALPALSVAFSPDGRRLASCSGKYWETDTRGKETGELAIWDAATGEAVRTLEGHSGSIHQVAFHPDGAHLASAGADGTVKVWDAGSGERLGDLKGHTDVVMGLAYSPDGRRLASASLDGTARVWDADNGEPLATLREPDDRFFAVAFSPDSRRLAAASRSWVVRLWDVASGHKIETYRGQDREVTGLAFSPDGRRLASSGYGGVVKVWDATRGQGALTLKGHAGAVFSVALAPDGRRVVTADRQGPLHLRDVATGGVALTAEPLDGPVASVALSRDGAWLAGGSADSGTVAVWDAATGRKVYARMGHDGLVYAVAFSPDGRTLASGGKDGRVRLWDVATGRARASFRGSGLAITALAFSPDGRALAASTADPDLIDVAGDVTVRQVATGRVLRVLRGHRGGISDLAYSPDGRTIATASWDRSVAVWDVASGERVHAFGIRGLIVWAVAFTPDGRRLVAADNIGRMTFWDAESGQEVLTLRGHSDRIYDLAFSADGRLLASTSRDATAKVWDATPLDEAAGDR